MNTFEKSPSLLAFENALLEGKSILFEGLWDAPISLLAALALKKTKRSILLITGGVREDKLFDNLSYFLNEAPLEFPSWETLPGEEIAPSPDILGKRFEALHTLLQKKTPSIVLCPLQALLQKTLPPKALSPLFSIWKKGTKLSFQTLPERLTDLGYRRTPVVTDKGEFAVRGGILDLFPVAALDPYRIEFFDDVIESIRTFDPSNQKSIGKADTIFLSPAQELPLLQKASSLSSILDYLGQDPLIFFDDLLPIEDAAIKLQEMPGAKTPLFWKFHDFLEQLTKKQMLFGAHDAIDALTPNVVLKERTKSLQALSFDMFQKKFEALRFFHPFRKVNDYFLPEEMEDDETQLLDYFKPEKNLSLLFLNSTETEEADLKKKLPPLPQNTRFEKGYLASGFVISDIPFALIPNIEITQKTRIRRQKWRGATHTPAAEFHQLAPGDFVVHYHSGIGKYLGMEKQKNHLGAETEFLTIQYAESGKLFVPLSQAYLVSRYIGGGESAPSLSELGSKRWQNTRMNAEAQIVGYANDLLQLYAERASAGGFRFTPDSELLSQFESDFPYAETQDQLFAIEAIKTDMISEKAMDRLICGDVGYGKTEVAMRAAFKAVVDGGKQVAVLVPTTVLAMQHFDTFSERMQGFPIKVGTISRFRTAKENKETLQKVADGQIDILIGTHRILSQDVLFKDLGLLIIDEEQRFGVRAKEHLKKLKVGVDCLTLSATPIPRTLYMSLVSARDMSVIATPPQDRLPIKTVIAETDPTLIQNALLREFSREGQAFYIHNRVETIHSRAAEIQKLVPAARIGVVHGQMDADEIDTLFHRFKQSEIDLLFATTIIENGIDIPNANTILIDRADTYGLADLYQLKGRVGRWNRSAYAYFLIPKHVRLPEIARKRLNALVEAGSHGGGMKLAMRDLEIRGAGNLLGVQQSGQVSAIGFHLYCKLLKKAIDALKKKKSITFHETKLEFPFDARLPSTYIPEVSLRMEIYHRLGDATTFDEIASLLTELQDRFGPPPPEVTWLYHLTRIRIFAAGKAITHLKFQNLSLTAEIQKGKLTEKKTILMPKKIQTPELLESYVIEKLKEIS